ncbi:MAG: hypothetical protein NZ957_06415 [Thaumarchaeota archaeon]|nr:hypothetical protein [Candidatus Calditenuaceae archaeon]MDW8042284.1 hypothetical protein [Nitrososphaerota archaeon]
MRARDDIKAIEALLLMLSRGLKGLTLGELAVTYRDIASLAWRTKSLDALLWEMFRTKAFSVSKVYPVVRSSTLADVLVALSVGDGHAIWSDYLITAKMFLEELEPLGEEPAKAFAVKAPKIWRTADPIFALRVLSRYEVALSESCEHLTAESLFQSLLNDVMQESRPRSLRSIERYLLPVPQLSDDAPVARAFELVRRFGYVVIGEERVFGPLQAVNYLIKNPVKENQARKVDIMNLIELSQV